MNTFADLTQIWNRKLDRAMNYFDFRSKNFFPIIILKNRCLTIYIYINLYLSLLQVIAAEGEQKASRALKDASDVMSESSAALQLRYLQVYNPPPLYHLKETPSPLPS